MLAHSRTMKGSGAAGVAMLVAGGVEVAQTVLAETHSAIVPLVPNPATMRPAFFAAALTWNCASSSAEAISAWSMMSTF